MNSRALEGERKRMEGGKKGLAVRARVNVMRGSGTGVDRKLWDKHIKDTSGNYLNFSYFQ